MSKLTSHKLRARKLLSFLLHGIVGAASLVAVFWAILTSVFAGHALVTTLIITMMAFAPCSFIWGVAIWWLMQRRNKSIAEIKQSLAKPLTKGPVGSFLEFRYVRGVSHIMG